MACDVMHGMFSDVYMATHTVAGGNSKKTAMNRNLVDQIIGNFSISLLTELLLHKMFLAKK
jgi:hypothetical protein